MGYEMRILESRVPEKEQRFLPESALIDFNSTESFTIYLLQHQIRIIFFIEKDIWRRSKHE